MSSANSFTIPHQASTWGIVRHSRFLGGAVRRALPIFASATLGITLSVAAWILVARWEDRHAALAFDVVAENHFMVLQNGLTEYLGKLRALHALFDSSDDGVTRNEFEAFARPVLQSSSALRTLSWAPRVLRDERSAHEAEGVRDGIANYHIKSRTPGGGVSRSAEYEEYFPVFFATVPKDSPLYGLDLRSEPPTLAELEEARDGDRLGFSEVPELVSAEGHQHGFIFSLPIYRRGSPHGNVEERRRNLVGFVHGSFVTAKMMGDVIAASTTAQGLDASFLRPGGTDDELPLYVHNSRLRKEPLQPRRRGALVADAHWSRDLMAGNQPWVTFVATAMPGGPLTPRHDRAWIVLISGLLISAVAVVYICKLRKSTFRLMRANRKVSELAQTDSLTRLLNRRAFLDQLALAVANSERGGAPFAVLYIDVDHFKDVNDTLGHASGDELLQLVAGRMGGLTRRTDVVARLGGDEFAILQSHVTDASAAGVLAGTVNGVLAGPYVVHGNTVHISASIGISIYSPAIGGPAAMMVQADLALYRAKEDGRNCFRFHSAELDCHVNERVTMAEELRLAVGRGELQLYYQPQVELASGRIIGLEALLRWNHPTRGLTLPSVFIPIAERTGCIAMLGEWAFDEACRQSSSWLEERIAPESIAVNFSAVQFKRSFDLEREMTTSLARWGVAAEKLEIELTESVLMEVTEQHSGCLDRLRRIGLKIAIDDFGTGYSSLSYLTNFPISRLKIAQQLVFRVDTDTRNATVVRAAIRLARELGIECIAEGVETEAQARFLMSAGCEQVQGFYFSPPVPAQRATELLRHATIKPARAPLRIVKTTAA